jgi:hypothetical protein
MCHYDHILEAGPRGRRRGCDDHRLGRWSAGRFDIVDQPTVDLTWDDGMVTTLAVHPYAANPLSTSIVAGSVVLCASPLGIMNVTATTDYVRVYMPAKSTGGGGVAQPPCSQYRITHKAPCATDPALSDNWRRQ